MLDLPHRVALRAVAQGAAPADSPALRNLALAGLVAAVGGRWALTERGQAVLQVEPADGDDLKSKIAAWFTT